MKNIYLSEPGLVCCAGKNKEELYESCLKGDRGGITPKEIPGGKRFPTGQIPFELSGKGKTRITRIIETALEQLKSDIEKAAEKYGKDRIGVCFGTCDNGSEDSLDAHKMFLEGGAFPKDYKLHNQSAFLPAEFIAAQFGLKGPCYTVATACASGSSAIIRGAELIRAGICDAVIAGGADVVSETVLLGFHALEAVSQDFTNPFSKNRNGINLGEGAAFFLLDSSAPEEDSYIELLGFGESSDAYHMTAPSEDGSGPAKAMLAAISNARLSPQEIGYVNFHGTGTPLNDSAESKAMKTVFGDYEVPASSTKPIMGHTLGAAGALETAVCWMVLKENRGLPVHVWDGEKDEELSFFPTVTGCNASSGGKMSVCMNNNFAFGGCNVSLILGRRPSC
jgi:3-oxoacyl-[acyl-carrier-protein] synthase-1